MITSSTEYVKVHIRTTHRGDVGETETNITADIYVGDFDTIEGKRVILEKRVSERAASFLKIEFDIIA